MNFKILSVLILGIFLISAVSAMTVYSEFEDESQSITITEGNTVTFTADFFSMNTPISSMKVRLYSETGLVYSFLDSNTNQRTYSETFNYVANVPGTYEIEAMGTDRVNSDSNTLTLIVLPEGVIDPTDTIAPVINLIGSSLVTIQVGDTYTDAGATATDNVDGDITSRIVVSGIINTNVVGDYILTYNVEDNAGNSATATRTVRVILGAGALEITSEPDTEVDENDEYSYQVEVTGEVADVTYSLGEHPSWLSISPAGEVYGTAPRVNSDTEYTVEIIVSDGTSSDTQEYELTVDNGQSKKGSTGGYGDIEDNHPKVNLVDPNLKKTSTVITNETKMGWNPTVVLFSLISGVLVLGIAVTSVALIKRIPA